MSVELAAALVSALVTAIGALVFVVKKTTCFGERALEKFDNITNKVEVLTDSNKEIACSNRELRDEMKRSNTILERHISDGRVHISDTDRVVLDELKTSGE